MGVRTLPPCCNDLPNTVFASTVFLAATSSLLILEPTSVVFPDTEMLSPDSLLSGRMTLECLTLSFLQQCLRLPVRAIVADLLQLQ